MAPAAKFVVSDPAHGVCREADPGHGHEPGGVDGVGGIVSGVGVQVAVARVGEYLADVLLGEPAGPGVVIAAAELGQQIRRVTEAPVVPDECWAGFGAL